jgi:glycine C-acetyltransferase
MADLEAKLNEAKMCAQTHRNGRLPMDGLRSPISRDCELPDKYQALTMIDDAHATGFPGRTGRGTHEYRGVMGRIDIITGTLGKALGGASGGFTSAKADRGTARQRSRPYLFPAASRHPSSQRQ